MDLNSAERNIHKLLSYIKSISDSDTTLYDKSKRKLTEISNSCMECIKEISIILQTESLDDDELEFDMNPESKSNLDLQNQVNILTDEINKIKAFINQGNNDFDESSFDSNMNSKNNSIQNSSIISYNYDTTLSSSERSNIVKDYKFILNRTSMNDCKFNIINRCTRILWNWFDARILKTYNIAPTFHYDVHRFKSIIYSFVISMGYHIENNTFDEFESNFDDWVASLSTSNESNKWIAPFEVYNIERGNCSEYITLTAVILWDILLDCGIRELCKSKSSTYLNEKSIWDIISDINIDVLDNYFNYKENIKLLEDYNIV